MNIKSSFIFKLVLFCSVAVNAGQGNGGPVASGFLKCDDPNFDLKLAQGLGGGRAKRAPTFTSRTESGYRVDQKVASLMVAGAPKDITYNHYRAQTRPALGTVIFMCGGPGDSCLQHGRPKSLPSGVDVVVFDYVGVGNNAAGKISVEQMSVESQGAVAAGLAKKLELKNYVLYGQSFGTAVGTVAASLLSGDPDANKPKMLVLDGVIGDPGHLDPTPAIRRTADKAWSRLGAKAQGDFTEAYRAQMKDLKGAMRDGINGYLTAPLSQGPDEVLKSMREFTAANKRNKGRPLSSLPGAGMKDGSGDGAPVTDQFLREFRAAGCQMQFMPKSPGQISEMTVFGGQVPVRAEGAEGVRCECPLIRRPYDSKDHLVRDTPIVYVNSDTDVTTPIEGARYHLQHQTATDQKLLFATEGGIHDEIEGRYGTCAQGFWEAAMSGDLALVKAETVKLGPHGCLRPAGRSQRGKSGMVE